IEPGRVVSANGHALIATVRQAQDVESFDEGFDWAEVVVTVRLVTKPPSATTRRVVHHGVLATPSGHISIGDADGFVTVPSHEGATVVVISVGADLPDDEIDARSHRGGSRPVSWIAGLSPFRVETAVDLADKFHRQATHIEGRDCQLRLPRIHLMRTAAS